MRSVADRSRTLATGIDNRVAAQRQLLIDRVTLEVVAAMRRDGSSPLLLKGPAIATWIYSAGETRFYVDTDLLVSPSDLAQASSSLKRLGFTQTHSDRYLEDFAEPHAETWQRAAEGITIDLHWRIPGIGASPSHAWEVLSENPGAVCVGTTYVEALRPTARALHLALHAVQNGRRDQKSLRDLERGLGRLEDEVWDGAATLASQVGASDPFAVAMAMTPMGSPVSERHGISAPSDSVWHLWATTPPPGAVRLKSFVSAGSGRERARMVAAAAFPPPTYMRAIYPLARRGVAGLCFAYSRRLGAGMATLPGAWRAIRAERKL